jgi:hypothetical protein
MDAAEEHSMGYLELHFPAGFELGALLFVIVQQEHHREGKADA